MNMPKTKEEARWWHIGFEEGKKEAERLNELYIKVGKPIVDAINDRACDCEGLIDTNH